MVQAHCHRKKWGYILPNIVSLVYPKSSKHTPNDNPIEHTHTHTYVYIYIIYTYNMYNVNVVVSFEHNELPIDTNSLLSWRTVKKCRTKKE